VVTRTTGFGVDRRARPKLKQRQGGQEGFLQRVSQLHNAQLEFKQLLNSRSKSRVQASILAVCLGVASRALTP